MDRVPNHVAWARAQQSWWPLGGREDPTKGLLARFDERQGIAWLHDPRSGKAQRRIAPALLRKEVETCGRCHARRSEISEDWVPGHWLSDTHVVSPLANGLYSVDGQMRDVEETYNDAPFKQSKMFSEGVTCSDCHDPHSAKPRLAGEGVCLQCHAPATYATIGHGHHEGVDAQPDCVSCHMSARTYMVVDRRHDHSMRVPRPDLSVRLGTPNACNYCHADKSAEWAAAAVERWFGPNRKGYQTYAEAFQAAWSDRADSAKLLAAVAADGNAPGIARARALTELASRISPANIDVARRGLVDSDPMIRIGAMDMLESVPAPQIWPLVGPLLSDPVRGVRIRAASLLAPVPTASQPPGDRERFESAAAEFIAAQRLDADRPEARSALGNFYARRALTADAEAEFKAGLRLSPQFAPAAINLADLYRRGRDGEGESVLRAAIAKSPQDAGLHHALGLTLTRLKRPDDALGELRRATELEPERARYAYVYAVGLHSAGRRDQAMAVMKETQVRHPGERDTLLALISISRDAGDLRTALEYAEQLDRMAPNDPSLVVLIENLRRQIKKPDAQ
jgi:Flp pilus assembly protein TadD